MTMSQRIFPRPLRYGFLVASAACALFIGSAAFAAPIPAGSDSFATLNGSEQSFGADPIPADFFDPGSDPFDAFIGWVGVPLGPGATTDTIIERLDKAKFSGPKPASDTIRIQIREMSFQSVDPITVNYSGDGQTELWNVRVGLSATPQPIGSMTIREEEASGGSFDWILPILPRFTFTRISDGVTRVIDYGALGLPAVELHARAVPWLHKTTFPEVIHAPKFCPACDSPDGVPIEIFESANFLTYIIFPATTIP